MARTAMMPQQQRAPQRRNNWYGIAAFIALLALVAGGIVLFNMLKNKDASRSSSFELPNVVGQPLDEATKALEDAGLAFNKIEQADTGCGRRCGRCRPTRSPATIVTTGQAIMSSTTRSRRRCRSPT